MNFRLIFFILAIFSFDYANAQLKMPSASPMTTIKQELAYANLEVSYSRPSVKARKIFGELVPYGSLWRTGANKATTISIDQDFFFGDMFLKAGSYSLLTIPGEKQWEVILNSDTSLWGTNGYDSKLDVARITIEPERLRERLESFEMRFTHLRTSSALLVLEWEYTRVRIPLGFKTIEKVKELTDKSLKNSKNGDDFYTASRFYFDNDMDIEQALSWMDKKIALDGPSVNSLYYKARILQKLNRTDEASKSLNESLALAKEAGQIGYVQRNQKLLKKWGKAKSEIAAAELIELSKQYHDPNGTWSKYDWNLEIIESRPDGRIRRAEVVLNPGADKFQLVQHESGHSIGRNYSNGVFSNSYDNYTDYSEEVVNKFRLNEKYNQLYKNYYEYLWGMPMKLTDEGTHLGAVYERDFFGQSSLELQVKYDEAVGNDIWYFYFDPSSYRLLGYKFYHDESKNDGEYILFQDELEMNGVKLPKKRSWYMNFDQKFIGMDELITLGINSQP